MHSLKVFGAEELDRSKISQNSKNISTGVEALVPIWHKDDPEPDEIELLKNFSLFDSLPRIIAFHRSMWIPGQIAMDSTATVDILQAA
jgi:hypothetical protein